MIREFLNKFNLIELNNKIPNIAAQIRKTTKINLPDAYDRCKSKVQPQPTSTRVFSFLFYC